MVPIPAPESPPRDCDACVAYDCKIKFPAEFHGKYGAWGSYEGKDGVLCILHHRDAVKDAKKCTAAIEQKKENADFNFQAVLFCGDYEFLGQIENADFSRSTFTGEADFRGATFSGATHFNSATFRGTTIFRVASFKGKTDFTNARFSGKANFNGATFNGAADFGGARFCSRVDFRHATFSCPANFGGATFNGEADFKWATFKEEAFFDDLAKEINEHRERIGRKVELDFRWETFGQPEKIHFRNLNLSEALFLHTDVRKVRFINVFWPPKLRDEKEAKKDEYPHVEALYRQLRQNYEDSRNYPDAGHFYYGEMQMRRKAKWWRRYLPSLTTLYWLSSGYGQRPVRAFVWIGVLYSFFAGLYMLGGLQLQHSGLAAANNPPADTPPVRPCCIAPRC